MRIWATTRRKQRIASEVIRDFDFGEGRPGDLEGWTPVIGALCEALDLARPVILQKHVAQLHQFSRTAFLPADFMETVAFDRFELEIFPEQKKQRA